MDQNIMIETVIRHLTGIRVTIYRQDITEKPSVEDRQPARKVTAGLNFPGNPELAKGWEKHLKKENMSFSLAEPLVFAWCQWFRENQKKLT